MAEGGACEEIHFPPGFKLDRRRHSVDTADRFIPRRSVIKLVADPKGAHPLLARICPCGYSAKMPKIPNVLCGAFTLTETESDTETETER